MDIKHLFSKVDINLPSLNKRFHKQLECTAYFRIYLIFYKKKKIVSLKLLYVSPLQQTRHFSLLLNKRFNNDYEHQSAAHCLIKPKDINFKSITAT